MKNVSETWKHSNVFEKQLAFNLKELDGKYPPHWNDFIYILKFNKHKNILDIGCGCGALYELCKREIPTLKYYGIDYSENAIMLAKKTWCKHCFSVKDCVSLTEDYVSEYDIIHMGALLDVLPNGDEILEQILSLSPKNILITRVKLTNKESYFNTYEAYGEIITCEYYHNSTNFFNLCVKYSYDVTQINNNFYLTKIR